MLLLLGVPLIYSIFRYHVVNGVDWPHFPRHIANKSIFLAAVFFIGTSYMIGKTLMVYKDGIDKRLILVKFCGLMGFSLAAMHAFMSLFLKSPITIRSSFTRLAR